MSKKTKAPPSIQTSADTRTVIEIAADLEKARNAKSKFDWRTSETKRAAGIKLVADLEAELAEAQLRELPVPAKREIQHKAEADVLLKDIWQSGNHRETINSVALQQLARSLETDGLQQRIGVRLDTDGKFELIWGSRRLAAAKLLGWDRIAAKIYPADLTTDEIENLRTIENINRAELTPTERALAIARMLEQTDKRMSNDRDFETQVIAAGGLEAYVGQRLGHPAAWVRDFAYINRLTGKARELLAAGRLDLGHARELAKIADPKEQASLASMAARDEKNVGGINVDTLRNRVNDTLRSLRGVPWRLDIIMDAAKPGMVKAACSSCRYNSLADPSLFEHDAGDTKEAILNAKAGTCTNPACFSARKEICERELPKATANIVKTAKKNEIPVTPRSVDAGEFGDNFPGFLRPETLARKARAQIDPPKPKASSSSNGDHQYSSRHNETPEQKAVKQYAAARDEWAVAISKSIRSKLEKVPGAMIVDQAMEVFDTYQLQFQSYVHEAQRIREDQARAVKAWEKLRPIVMLITRPLDADGVKQLDAAMKKESRLADFDGYADVVLLEMALELGVEFKDPPILDTFLKDAKKPATAPADKPAIKGKKKQKPAPVAANFDADLEDEEES